MELIKNMNYELAKELKDIGFPQVGASLSGYLEKDSNATFEDSFYRGHYIGKSEDWIYKPTLFELIEACGDSLTSISRWKEMSNKEKNTWQVMGKRNTVNFHYLGSNIEEAVARLWIGLNGK